METKKETMVVNIFAGPGAGKTTAAWEIAAMLKKKGIDTEYVPEYAKELVWDESDAIKGTLENQRAIYNEQKHRVDRLLGKVDVVVTDSPAILSVIYALDELNPAEELKVFREQIIQDFAGYRNFNLFIERNPDLYQQSGRIHTLEQAKVIDEQVKTLLKDNGIYFGIYRQNRASLLCGNIISHLKKRKTQS